MGKLEIQINDKEHGSNETVSTNGVVLFYLDEYNGIKVTGKLDTIALIPLITKIMMEKMNK